MGVPSGHDTNVLLSVCRVSIVRSAIFLWLCSKLKCEIHCFCCRVRVQLRWDPAESVNNERAALFLLGRVTSCTLSRPDSR